MTLSDYRTEIDRVDRGIIALFCERMRISEGIAEAKREAGLPVCDPAREEKKLEDVAALSDPEFAEYTKELYRKLFELSKRRQEEKLT